MNPDWESEEDTEGRDQRAANAERDALRRAQMIGRARERKAYWQRELALERFDEFKGEMRRRIQVEQTLLDGLEHSDTPTFILLKTYQQDAVHLPSQPGTKQDEERADLLERIQKASQRRKDLLRRLELTPQRQTIERTELTRKIAKEGEYIADLQVQVRALR
ncbi:MAG: hypothetical protein WC359_15470 [Dehalococcoidia bacterium]|jgi:hypothetical protein